MDGTESYWERALGLRRREGAGITNLDFLIKSRFPDKIIGASQLGTHVNVHMECPRLLSILMSTSSRLPKICSL